MGAQPGRKRTAAAGRRRDPPMRTTFGLWLRSSIGFLLCIIFFVPFIVADGRFFPALLFPYLTAKTLAFRVMVEVAAGLYLLLALHDPQYRPRASRLKYATSAFVAWGAVAVFTSIDPIKSFWSNVERMDGYLTLLHLFAYFFIVGSFITAEKRWTQFLQVSLFASTLMAIYGVLQAIGVFQISPLSFSRIDGAFGNPAFLAAYLLFGIFIALFLLALESKAGAIRWAYAGSIAVQSVALYFTQTRGTILGLLVGLIVAAAFIAWRARTPELRFLRRASWCALATAGFIVLAFLAVRELPIIQKSDTLRRIAAISLRHNTVQPRLRAWGIVWEAFLERPVFGWGQENFNSVASKFFDQPMDEVNAWYDRAHNQFLDWLVAGGLPMLGLYVSLFVLAGWSFALSSLAVPARAVPLGLLAAYAVNNLVTFDGIFSAIYFWLVLAFADSLSPSTPVPLLQRISPISASAMAVAAPVVAAVVGCGIWLLNAPGYVRAQELLNILSIETQEHVVTCSRAAVVAAC
jgi:O-antigen ligase